MRKLRLFTSWGLDASVASFATLYTPALQQQMRIRPNASPPRVDRDDRTVRIASPSRRPFEAAAVLVGPFEFLIPERNQDRLESQGEQK